VTTRHVSGILERFFSVSAPLMRLHPSVLLACIPEDSSSPSSSHVGSNTRPPLFLFEPRLPRHRGILKLSCGLGEGCVELVCVASVASTWTTMNRNTWHTWTHSGFRYRVTGPHLCKAVATKSSMKSLADSVRYRMHSHTIS
jgi:hypothetical protein